MTKASFTIGPWRVLGEDTLLGGEPVLEIGDGDPNHEIVKPVAYVQPTFHDENGEGEFALEPEDIANAHLIAQSPAMYDALYVLEDYAQDRCVDAEEWEDTDTVLIPVTIGDLRKGIEARKQARGEAS